MKFVDIIAEARRIIQDLTEDSITGAPLQPRFSPKIMEGFANQALKRVATLRPDLFITEGTFVARGGSSQTVLDASPRATRLVDVIQVSHIPYVRDNTFFPGEIRTVLEVDKDSLDQLSRDWVSILSSSNDSTFHLAVAAFCSNYTRDIRRSTHFYIYPSAPRNTSVSHFQETLTVTYVESPKNYSYEDTDAEVELLPEVYFPAVVDATVFIAESTDNESVTSGRAQLYYQSFTQALGVATQSRVITDREDSGVNLHGAP